MSETLSLVLALMAGVLLGALFFGGLWWTIRKSFSSQQPALWFFASSLLRTVLVLAGFYFIALSHWQRLLAALLGFALARLMVTRFTRATEKPAYFAQEASHAP
jgi:F1F0 ATPase subunit 2